MISYWFNGSLVTQKHTAGVGLSGRNAYTGLESQASTAIWKHTFYFVWGPCILELAPTLWKSEKNSLFLETQDLLKDMDYWIWHLTVCVRLISSSTGNSGKLTLLLWTRSGEPDLADYGKKKTKQGSEQHCCGCSWGRISISKPGFPCPTSPL